jgi:hypothetical protein
VAVIAQIHVRSPRGSVPRTEARDDLGGEQPHMADSEWSRGILPGLVDIGRGASLKSSNSHAEY